MTVQYDDNIFKFFFKWRGSVWQLVWLDILVWLLLYYALNLTYRFGLDLDSREHFEELVESMAKACDAVDNIVSFLLGFFVSSNVARWWEQFQLMPWPEELMYSINFVIFETDEEAICLRKAVARYFCLTTALSGRALSSSMRNRFPAEEDLLKVGLMTQQELDLYKSTLKDVQDVLPMTWVQRLLEHEVKERNLPAPHSNQIETEIGECVTKFRKLFCYDWVGIPLVYTQCVALITLTYYFAMIIGQQFVDPLSSDPIDYFFPLFGVLQIVFVMGWFRLGLKLMKPFGDDEEDFEVNTLLDRHLEVAFDLADAPTQPLPELRDLRPLVLREQTQKELEESTSGQFRRRRLQSDAAGSFDSLAMSSYGRRTRNDEHRKQIYAEKARPESYSSIRPLFIDEL